MALTRSPGNNPKLKNEYIFDTLGDDRETKGADNILHKVTTKTRSGHVIEYNDNIGAESITIQHRSGQMVQMQHDGSMRFVSTNGKMGFEINGEGYVEVTGVYNIHAKGDVGFRFDNDFDLHVGGNMKLTCDKTLSIAAKNMTTKIIEKYEVAAHDIAMGAVQNSVFTSGNRTSIWADANALLRSGDNLYLIGDSRVDINP